VVRMTGVSLHLESLVTLDVKEHPEVGPTCQVHLVASDERAIPHSSVRSPPNTPYNNNYEIINNTKDNVTSSVHVNIPSLDAVPIYKEYSWTLSSMEAKLLPLAIEAPELTFALYQLNEVALLSKYGEISFSQSLIRGKELILPVLTLLVNDGCTSDEVIVYLTLKIAHDLGSTSQHIKNTIYKSICTMTAVHKRQAALKALRRRES
jgi:hypothetical protein